MSKSSFLKNAATPDVKRASTFSFILTLLLIAAMVFSFFYVHSISLEEIPIVSVAIEEDPSLGKSLEEAKDLLRTQTEKMENTYNNNMDVYSSEEQEIIEEFIEVAFDTAECFSLNNLNKLADVTEKAFNEAYQSDDELGSSNSLMDDINEAREVFDYVSTAVIVCIAVILFFSALGGLFKKKALVIIGLILSVIYCLIFCGYIPLIILAAIHLALIVCLGKINKAYKEYKRQAMNQPNDQYLPPQYPQY